MNHRVDGSKSFSAPAAGTLVAIGNFDGVHQGHVRVLTEARAEAEARGLAPLVLTFDPHPAAVLGKKAPDVLTPLARKIDLLVRAAQGLEVVVEPFTLELSRLSPDLFADQLLHRALGARLAIVGRNFRFGQGRAGDLDTLVQLGKQYGFEARALDLLGDGAGAFSSSRVREQVRAGAMDAASQILGRPHALTGQVVKGDARGRSIGFPTANLDGVHELLPPHGVYACCVDSVGEAPRALAHGVANVGVRPTVRGGFSVEAHLLDYEGDLYGQTLRVHLLARLRGEQKFAGLEELKAQIARDAAAAAKVAAESCPLPASGGAFF